jgi:hypothetical protein
VERLAYSGAEAPATGSITYSIPGEALIETSCRFYPAKVIVERNVFVRRVCVFIGQSKAKEHAWNL